MSEGENDSGIPKEETVIHNLPLYTERKADGIYRYRRRVPKALVGRVGKGYLYRNLGRRKDDVARASQRKPRASTIRPTTGLGSGCTWSGRGWGRDCN